MSKLQLQHASDECSVIVTFNRRIRHGFVTMHSAVHKYWIALHHCQHWREFFAFTLSHHVALLRYTAHPLKRRSCNRTHRRQDQDIMNQMSRNQHSCLHVVNYVLHVMFMHHEGITQHVIMCLKMQQDKFKKQIEMKRLLWNKKRILLSQEQEKFRMYWRSIALSISLLISCEVIFTKHRPRQRFRMRQKHLQKQYLRGVFTPKVKLRRIDTDMNFKLLVKTSIAFTHDCCVRSHLRRFLIVMLWTSLQITLIKRRDNPFKQQHRSHSHHRCFQRWKTLLFKQESGTKKQQLLHFSVRRTLFLLRACYAMRHCVVICIASALQQVQCVKTTLLITVFVK